MNVFFVVYLFQIGKIKYKESHHFYLYFIKLYKVYFINETKIERYI